MCRMGKRGKGYGEEKTEDIQIYSGLYSVGGLFLRDYGIEYQYWKCTDYMTGDRENIILP